MGNGMMCATTPKTGVAQGSANNRVAGAPPPPPPTGAVGGGGALHPCGVEVAQVAPVCLSQFPITPSGTQWVQVGANVVANVVPMRSRCGHGAGAVRGLAFSLPKIRGKNDG